MQPNWEIWLDNNVASIIGKWLKDDFNLVVKSAYTLQTKTMSDIEFYNKAKKAGNVIIISKDSDILDLINLHGAPPKLINIKSGNKPNRILYSVLKRHIERAIRFLTDFDNDIIQIEIEI